MITTTEVMTSGALTIQLFGTVRGKVVASLAHAYALSVMKLALAPATRNAPWRPEGGKPQDYFAWRKNVVNECSELEVTLSSLLGGSVPPMESPQWPLSGGYMHYDTKLAGMISQEYAKMFVRMMGLANDPAKVD